jgi:hypothetical protein
MAHRVSLFLPIPAAGLLRRQRQPCWTLHFELQQALCNKETAEAPSVWLSEGAWAASIAAAHLHRRATTQAGGGVIQLNPVCSMASPATERRLVAVGGVTRSEPRASAIAFRSEPSVVTAIHLLARARAASTGQIMREALVGWLQQNFDQLDPRLQPEAELVIEALQSTRSHRRGPRP